LVFVPIKDALSHMQSSTPDKPYKLCCNNFEVINDTEAKRLVKL